MPTFQRTLGRVSVNELLRVLADRNANRATAQMVMDEVRTNDYLVEFIMKQDLLPDLCSLLRRAFGRGRNDNETLNFMMHQCYNVGRQWSNNYTGDKVVPYNGRTYSTRIMIFASYVAQRYFRLTTAEVKP